MAKEERGLRVPTAGRMWMNGRVEGREECFARRSFSWRVNTVKWALTEEAHHHTRNNGPLASANKQLHLTRARNSLSALNGTISFLALDRDRLASCSLAPILADTDVSAKGSGFVMVTCPVYQIPSSVATTKRSSHQKGR